MPFIMRVQVVITHFTEPWDLVWDLLSVLVNMLHQYTLDIVIYQRGGDQYAYKRGDIPTNIKIVTLENIGRESYVVHYHILKNYDDLPDKLMFIPANWKGRVHALNQMLMCVTAERFTPAPCVVKWENEQYFTIDKWHGTSEMNRQEVEKQEFTLSAIRPFGEWYKQRIPVPYKDLAVLNGIFSVPKKNILRYPRESYERWLEELRNSGPNPEVGHYWERTWYALFS